MSVLDSFHLHGRVALVTGGSKGLGKVIAQALAEAGADVAIISRTESDCDATCCGIERSTGRRTCYAAADLTDGKQLASSIDKIQAELGPIDILVNNAGINVRGLAQELTEEQFDQVVAINLKAPFLASRILGPQMCERGWGRVINLGSILSVVALPGRARPLARPRRRLPTSLGSWPSNGRRAGLR